MGGWGVESEGSGPVNETLLRLSCIAQKSVHFTRSRVVILFRLSFREHHRPDVIGPAARCETAGGGLDAADTGLEED